MRKNALTSMDSAKDPQADTLEAEKNKLLQQLQGVDMNRLPTGLFVEAVEQSPLAISITDKKANILYVNQAFSEVTGYSKHEAIGKNESLLSFKATPRHVYHDLWYTISRNKIWHGQLINRHKNGDPYLADLTVAPMEDGGNKVTHYLGIHRDISEQHKNAQKSLNQKLLIESVINASSVAMVVIDEQDKVILDNRVYKTLISDLNHEEPAFLFMNLISQEIGDVRAFLKRHPEGFDNIEVRLDDHHNKTMWFNCSGNLFLEKRTDAGSFFDATTHNYLLLSVADNSHLRTQQEALYLQSIKDRLVEEEQVRSIRETLLGAIFQISQPLHQIQAAIQLLHQKNEQGVLLDLLTQMETSCQKSLDTMQACVPEIIPDAITAVNLNQVLHEILQLSNSKFLRNGVTVEWLPATVLPHVLGSENKLRMLFKQLVDNAINAIDRSHKDERLINITTFDSSQRIYVSITDNGPGIPAALHNKVFEPFYTTEKWGGAQAGMGLVMVKEIINQLNGAIEIDPDYKTGCRFIISFPIPEEEDYGRFDT